MVIAIDGPAGAGKSSVARAVAGRARLHLPRHRRDVPLRGAREPAARRAGRPSWRRELRISLGERVLLDGEDVTDAIRTPGGLRGGLAGGRRPGGARARWSRSSGG